MDRRELAYRKHIEAALGSNLVWKKLVEQGHRLFDNNRGVDVTDECYAGFCRRATLATAILTAPPITLPPASDFGDLSDDYLG